MAAGANFVLLGPDDTMIKSRKPVVSVCAVRTGSGKSQTSRQVAEILQKKGRKVAAIRHPMPYGDLVKQKVQRFATYADLDKHECTIEEREEYEPHIDKGIIVYAGVDYGAILRQAEKEADVILWDGGNNDFPFYKSDLEIVVADPHRAGHELLLLPRRDQLPPGRGHRHQQDGHGRRRKASRPSWPTPRRSTPRPPSSGPTPRPSSRTASASAASASWSSRTARP